MKSIIMIVSVILILLGVIGFFNDPILGIFETDAVHSSFAVIVGVIGWIMSVKTDAQAKTFAKIFGIIFLLAAIIGFFQGTTVLNLFAVNMASNVLHLVVALILLWLGLKGGTQMRGSSM